MGNVVPVVGYAADGRGSGMYGMHQSHFVGIFSGHDVPGEFIHHGGFRRFRYFHGGQLHVVLFFHVHVPLVHGVIDHFSGELQRIHFLDVVVGISGVHPEVVAVQIGRFRNIGLEGGILGCGFCRIGTGIGFGSGFICAVSACDKGRRQHCDEQQQGKCLFHGRTLSVFFFLKLVLYPIIPFFADAVKAKCPFFR